MTSQPRFETFAAPAFPAETMRNEVAPSDQVDPLEGMGARIAYTRNAEIYGEDEPADFVYRVVSGAVRTSKLLSDGRRQISAFHTAGELFGLEAGSVHRFAAEAVVDSTVQVIRRSTVLAMASRDAALGGQLWASTARDLDRANEHMLLLGRKSAIEKLAAFLLDMSKRGPDGDVVELPMSRYDIADYLGLTIETVSRTLTQLEKNAAIELPSSRRIVLRNAGALRRLNA